MNPKERWEQEQMIEFQEFDVHEQLEMMEDGIEQFRQIAAVQEMLDEERQLNYEDAIVVQWWEQVAFIHQQLNEQ